MNVLHICLHFMWTPQEVWINGLYLQDNSCLQKAVISNTKEYADTCFEGFKTMINYQKKYLSDFWK